MKSTLKEIMLVEDDPDIQEVVKLALCSIGEFSVQICSSGAEALQKLTSFTPQLILLDVMMPNMDGPTVLKHIRNIPKFSTLPVIFITAKVQSNEIKAYLQMGACDVITKPFDPMSLAETVLTIWNRVPVA
jgi:CheY-like chemotaxis protein